MSTSTAPLDQPVAPEKSRGSVFPLLIAALASTLLALAIVAGAVSWLLKTGKLSAGASVGKKGNTGLSAAEQEVGSNAPEALPPSHVLALEPMVVNLSDSGAHSYVRASISLRLADEAKPKGKDKEEGKADKPDIGVSAALRDTTLGILGAQTSDGLLAPGGLDALKKRLRESYALDNRETHVLDVYVTDFLVQRG